MNELPLTMRGEADIQAVRARPVYLLWSERSMNCAADPASA